MEVCVWRVARPTSRMGQVACCHASVYAPPLAPSGGVLEKRRRQADVAASGGGCHLMDKVDTNLEATVCRWFYVCLECR